MDRKQEEMPAIGDGQRLVERLLGWFEESQRSLPWRRVRSVYGTLVSEFMLQQTQVKTVVPYFEAWMRRFPDFAAVAEAPLADVLKHWEGLGYYSRARNLQRTCQMIMAQSCLPTSPEEWKKFPGIGDYTSVAIASIGQNYGAIAVDGNVIRVLARIVGLQQIFDGKKIAEKCISRITEGLRRPGKCGQINEALMELGALICTAKDPKCSQCPIRDHCVSRCQGLNVLEIPRFRQQRRNKIQIDRLWIAIDGRILLLRSRVSRLKSLYELPKKEDVLAHFSALNFSAAEPIFEGKRAIGLDDCRERIVACDGIKFQDMEGLLAGSEDFLLCHRADLDRITISAPHRKWIEKLLP